MEETNTKELDDVDREGLVKEIEQIRQALGNVSNTDQSDARSELTEYELDEDEVADRDSEDTEDELAIIKSPRYRENAEEERLLVKQRAPIEVISSESEDEVIVINSTHSSSVHESVEEETRDEFSQDIPENASSEISAIIPRDNSEKIDLILIPVTVTDESQETQGILIPGTSTFEASSNQFDAEYPEVRQDGYTLVELQPAKNDSSYVDQESNDDECLSPVFELNYPTVQSVSEPEQGNDRLETGECRDPTESLNEDDIDVDDVGEKSEVHRCLSLNRKYQGIIEEELRKIERLLLENREMQFGFTQMSQSSLSKAEGLVFKQLTTYTNPYFKDKSKLGPPDNEDTKVRKNIAQPHPFEKGSKPWSKEEINILSDSVKSAVLEAKLTPLLQRIEILSPRRSKTEEEIKEIELLKAEVDRAKSLPLSSLVQNYALSIDWEDITDKVLPSRTPSQCEIYWYNELHPLLNKSGWTKDEDKKLLKLAKENNKEDWNKIARELKTNRTAVQCLRRYQRSLHKGFLKSKWEKNEDKQLIEAVRICGLGAWEKVSSLLDGRTGAQCMHRYMKSIKPDIKKGKWDKEEDDLLRKGIEKFGSNWSKIRAMIPHRTDSQIRERWSDVLDPRINKGQWTKKEDMKLLKLVEEQGTKNWTKIASQMPGRNDNRCWRRWRLLKKNDPEFQLQCATLVRKKATMVANFSGRPYDRPAIGPEDVDGSGLPIVKSIGNNSLPAMSSSSTVASTVSSTVTVTASSASTATKSSTGGMLTPQLGNAVQSPQVPGHKHEQRPGTGSLNTKRNKWSRSGRSNPSKSSDHAQRNTPNDGPSRITSSTTKSCEKVHDRENPNPPDKPATQKKLTAPNPIVVSQASALPNALPLTYLTQFSVLLQAFSVDVSGALKNVHSSGQRQVSSQSQSNHTAVATTASLRKTGVETVTQSSSQVTEACGTNTDTSDSKEVQINDTPRGRNSHVRDSCASQGEDCTTNVFQNVPNTDSSAGTSSCAKDTCVSQEVRNSNKQNMTNRNASGTRVLQKVPDTNKLLGKNCNASDSDILQETTDISGLYRANHDTSGDTVSRIIQNPRGLEGTYSDTCDTGVLQKITDKGKQNKKNRNAHGNNASHKVQNNVTDDSEEAYRYSSNACVSPEVEYFGEREGENDKASCAIHVNEEENSHDTEETRRIVSNSCSPQTVGDVRVDISESGQRSDEENEPKNDPGAPSLGDVVLSGSHHGLSHGVAGQPENGDSGCQDSIRLSATKQGRSPAGRHSKRKNYHNTENAKKKRRTSGGIKNKQGKRESCSEGEAVNELESTENTFGVMDVDVNNTNTEDVVNGRNKVDTIDNQLDSSLRSDKDSREKSLGNGMQQVEPSQRRYPIRSTRRHLQIDTDYVEPTVDARVEQVANSVLKPRNAQRGRRTAKVDTGKTRAEHMVRQNPKTDVEKGTAVVHGSDVRQVRVSMVPPLPPSATTLNAFKKLLTLRKDLKSQANSPKRLSEKQTVSQPEGIQRDVSQGSSGGKKVLQPTGRQTLTRIGNPLSDRLLVDSRESAGEEFQNSLPYQQLVNRFNGLFLWPGFLSIVNPNFSSKGGGAAPSPSKNARRDQLVSRKET